MCHICECEACICVFVCDVYMCLSVIELFPTGRPSAQLSAAGLQSGQITPLMNPNRRSRANSWASPAPSPDPLWPTTLFSTVKSLRIMLDAVVQYLQYSHVPRDPCTKHTAGSNCCCASLHTHIILLTVYVHSAVVTMHLCYICAHFKIL